MHLKYVTTVLFTLLLNFILSAWCEHCEYALDGVDDSATFNVGLSKLTDDFTISLWFRNNAKGKNSHIAQSIFVLKTVRASSRSW